MKTRILTSFPSQCGYNDCPAPPTSSETKLFVRKGYYYRSSDQKKIYRYTCRSCKRTFSLARLLPDFWQKKRHLNEPLELLFVSGVSQNRAAKILNTTRKTIVRKFLYLEKQAKRQLQNYRESLETKGKLSRVFFDEMESFERSKCLPVSIPLAVEPEGRKILAFQVCSMPAKGLLAKISRHKYGPRKDERVEAANQVWKTIQPLLSPDVEVSTDQNPNYPDWIYKHLPQARHKSYKGRRGCVVGQGELKRGGYDPLFAFNHTAAMLRANINRLFRRTWCTTKLKERLEAHIYIYASFHNRILT